jgi:glucose-6-phosphate isomerase
MSSFHDLNSVKKLQALSEHPLDLSEEKNFTTKRIEHMQVKNGPFNLLYATQRVSEPVLETLLELAVEAKAIEKNAAMQAGEVINKIEGFESENRMVLHTAMRDFFDHQNSSPKAKEAAKLAYQELEKLKGFLEEIDKKAQFTDVVQIGIGGSDLGPQAVYMALRAYGKPGRSVHFLSNVDPDDGARIFQTLDLAKTLFVSVSKSGGTLETLTNQEFVIEQLKKKGLNPKDHLVAVTGKGSPMDDPANYRASFYIWDYVGGRYSATSMVGGFILAFALGMNHFLDFLRGASSMDKLALSAEPAVNLPLLLALFGIWNRNFLELPTLAVIPYSQALSRFPAHLQQLDMESNGKRIDKFGDPVDFNTSPVIWGEPGTNGQHSFYQCIHQGTSTIPLDLIGFRNSQYQLDVLFKKTTCQDKLLANLFAQAIALATGQKHQNPNKVFLGNRPSSIILADRLDPFTMGALLSLYEHKVAFQGFIWNINSFDQEGVQLGKVLALKILDQLAAIRAGKAPDAAPFPLGAAILKSL